MSHLHLVDGVIGTSWWASGYLIAFVILVLAVMKINKEELAKRVPFIGVISALMLITMSIPVGFLPFHINLTVLAGILAGPWLGFVSIFIVNLILAFIGHGGITVVGLNTLIIGTEVFVGYYVFKAIIKYVNPVKAGIIGVVIALIISTTFMAGILVLTNAGLENALPHTHEELHTHDHSHQADISEAISEVQIFALSGWGAIAVILLFGIGLEAAVTAMIISFFIKVRPDMIQDVDISGQKCGREI